MLQDSHCCTCSLWELSKPVLTVSTTWVTMTQDRLTDLAFGLDKDGQVSRRQQLSVSVSAKRKLEGRWCRAINQAFPKWGTRVCQHDTYVWGCTVCASPCVWRWGLSGPWRSGGPAGCWCAGSAGGCWWPSWSLAAPASRWSFWTPADRWPETPRSGQHVFVSQKLLFDS